MTVKGLPKRASPTPDQLAKRTEFLEQLAELPPPDSSLEIPHAPLEPGNSKLGTSGTVAQVMFVWNLPAHATCPGASAWCLKHCYNADERTDKFPIDRWAMNWALFLKKEQELESAIVAQIHESGPLTAVRLHSSGDFFSDSYIRFWIRICSACPGVHFWAYTRSWAISELSGGLQELRSLPNMELFASWDNSLPAPPQDWRLSIVDGSGLVPLKNRRFVDCPEQDGRLPHCASCGYCFQYHEGDIHFALH